MSTITIKASDFNYPTRDERKAVSTDYPKLSKFRFQSINAIVSIMDKGEDFETVHRKNNLNCWNDCLQGRLWNLYQAYINAISHFSRGIPNGKETPYNNSNISNKLQFAFYAETYYYFFISCRDIVLHILNVYYKLGLVESKVSFKTIRENIADEIVRSALLKFGLDTKKASDFRNKFAHNFSINRPDNRTILENGNGRKSLSFNFGKQIPPEEIAENIKKSVHRLSEFLRVLQSRIPNS